MIIDCDECTARPSACGGCVVSHLLDRPAGGRLDGRDAAAVLTLAAAGLVPPLRLVRGGAPSNVPLPAPRVASTPALRHDPPRLTG